MSAKKKFAFDGVDFSRVAIVGSPGSGKTTLSVRLESILQVAAVHLDRELWLPGWQLRPEEERKKIHNGLIAADRWLIDGMWGSLVADRYCRATVVVHLDYPWTLCLARAHRRCRNSRGQQRFDMADGCPDKMDGEFVRYIMRFDRLVGRKLRALEAEHPEVTLFRLRSPRQTELFVKQLTEFFSN